MAPKGHAFQVSMAKGEHSSQDFSMLISSVSLVPLPLLQEQVVSIKLLIIIFFFCGYSSL
jgi:hypothetical protein